MDTWVYLSQKESYWNSYIRCAIFVGVDSNRRTTLTYKGATVRNIETPEILSSTEFRAFYFKIYDGNLEFGKEGDLSQVIFHSDADLDSLNYYTFDLYSETAKIRFCPSSDEGSS